VRVVSPALLGAAFGAFLAACSSATAPGTASPSAPAPLALAGDSVAPGGPHLANECATPQPGWIFCDDFDVQRLGKYFEYDSAGGRFTRVAGVGTDGSTAMRARFLVKSTNTGSLKLALGRTPTSYMRPADAGTATYRELYWRIYLRNQDGWIGGGGDKLTRATVFSGSNWSQAMAAHVLSGGQSTNNTHLLIDPASGTDALGAVLTTGYNDFAHLRWLGAATSVTSVFDASHVGQWHCIETHVRLNDAGQANGVFELWIDGAPEAQRTGLDWVGSYTRYGLNAIFLENFWNAGSPAAQERYLDNFVVSTRPIGC
jgi:hypothetical protein